MVGSKGAPARFFYPPLPSFLFLQLVFLLKTPTPISIATLHTPTCEFQSTWISGMLWARCAARPLTVIFFRLIYLLLQIRTQFPPMHRAPNSTPPGRCTRNADTEEIPHCPCACLPPPSPSTSTSVRA
jgi:hypothetical protein